MTARTKNLLLMSLVLGFFSQHSLSVSRAQERLEAAEQAFLWEIVGQEKSSYLFGTIHITDSRCTTLHPSAAEAFENADQLFVETSPADMAKQMAAIVLTDQSISDTMSEELIQRIDKQLADISPVLTHEAIQFSFGTPKLYAWSLLLPSLEAQLRNPNAEILDMKLISMAAEKGIPVGGMEDPETQLAQMDELTEEEQLAFLEDSLKAMEEADESGEDPEAELAEVYLKGDLDALQAFFDEENEESDLDQELLDRITHAMLGARNERIAQSIADALEESPEDSIFFAAGAAHFIGDDSVQHFLKQHGIEVRRISSDD